MQQASLFPEFDARRFGGKCTIEQEHFSHDEVCAEDERRKLEAKYGPLIRESEEFNRRLVSFQANKGALVHGWIRYKEGFSAQLVETLIRKLHLGPGDTVLDPFAGSGTTLLVAQSRGIDAVGIELLSMCHLIWEAKSRVADYDRRELSRIYQWLQDSDPSGAAVAFPHVAITEGAFPEHSERDLMYYAAWIEGADISDDARVLCRLVLTSILEEISYTRKDGQYLRWDHRSPKVQRRNARRVAQGKGPGKKMYKGELPAVKDALVRAFGVVLADIAKLQSVQSPKGRQKLVKGSALFELPRMRPDQFAAVITSPPYCNRYDYTRTYALEIAFLNGGDSIRNVRQNLLSCTVESRPKFELIANHYRSIGEPSRFEEIMQVIDDNRAYAEVNEALKKRWERKDLNNKGVLPMVRQYFAELTFVFAELYRTCQTGGHVVFVNDNVRYGGEVIPVDTLSTGLAQQLGFKPVAIHVLPQRKGNSSQQMGKFGRQELRKSITVWRKES